MKDSDGDAFNLTGSTVKSEIWLGNKRAKLADFTVAIINAALGKFSLNLTNQQTTNLIQRAYYDILVTDVLCSSNYWARGKAEKKQKKMKQQILAVKNQYTKPS